LKDVWYMLEVGVGCVCQFHVH